MKNNLSEYLISIVIPTYKEFDNIEQLINQIHDNMTQSGLKYHVLIVDDVSDDGSEELVLTLKKKFPIDIVVRHGLEKGLSSSVIDGLYQSKGDYLVVMDADLSHPSKSIPKMIEKLHKNQSTLILGSRYIVGGSINEDWSLFRLVNSKIATLMARPLVKVSDPMSGFFAIAKSHLPERITLNPIGYKIALEVMVKGNFEQIIEEPIFFQDRVEGKSKLTISEQLKYLRHLRRLYQYKLSTWAELFQFCLVGSTGMLIDLLIYSLLYLGLSLNHQIARAISFWPAASWNWYLNRIITFNQRVKSPLISQWLLFVNSSLIGFILNWGTYYVLTNYIEFFIEFKLLAFVIGIFVGLGFNFIISNLFVFHPYRKNK